MRIMLDTNVLISLILFPSRKFNCMLEVIIREHTLVLSSFVVEELIAVAKRKFPQKEYSIELFLSKLAYELVYTPQELKGGLFEIRDVKDYPVLYTAIVEQVDVLITGDKDFLNIDLEKPEILSPAQFCEKYL